MTMNELGDFIALRRPVPKPIRPKTVINIDDIIDFIIKAKPRTLITENYSISIFEKNARLRK